MNLTLRLGSWLNSCRAFLNNSRPNLSNIPCFYATTVKSIEERLGLPPKPKKPLTPYFRFMKEIRPTIVQQYPNYPLTEIVKLVAKKWETVDEATKAKLQESYKKDQVAYVEQKAKYDSKITEDQKRDLQKIRHEITEAKERRAVRKRVKELGRPKKPSSAFLKFIIKERSKADVLKQPYKEWHKKVCEKWARLSEEEKEKFKAESRMEMEVYKQQISKWEEKMVRMGHVDVVRQEAMIEPATSKVKKSSKSAIILKPKTE